MRRIFSFIAVVILLAGIIGSSFAVHADDGSAGPADELINPSESVVDFEDVTDVDGNEIEVDNEAEVLEALEEVEGEIEVLDQAVEVLAPMNDFSGPLTLHLIVVQMIDGVEVGSYDVVHETTWEVFTGNGYQVLITPRPIEGYTVESVAFGMGNELRVAHYYPTEEEPSGPQIGDERYNKLSNLLDQVKAIGGEYSVNLISYIETGLANYESYDVEGIEILIRSAMEFLDEFGPVGPEPELIEVTPVAPSQDGNLVAVPTVEGVIYSTGSFELTAENPTVRVTASADEGYILDGSTAEWTFTFITPEIELDTSSVLELLDRIVDLTNEGGWDEISQENLASIHETLIDLMDRAHLGETDQEEIDRLVSEASDELDKLTKSEDESSDEESSDESSDDESEDESESEYPEESEDESSSEESDDETPEESDDESESKDPEESDDETPEESEDEESDEESDDETPEESDDESESKDPEESDDESSEESDDKSEGSDDESKERWPENKNPVSADNPPHTGAEEGLFDVLSSKEDKSGSIILAGIAILVMAAGIFWKKETNN